PASPPLPPPPLHDALPILHRAAARRDRPVHDDTRNGTVVRVPSGDTQGRGERIVEVPALRVAAGLHELRRRPRRAGARTATTVASARQHKQPRAQHGQSTPTQEGHSAPPPTSDGLRRAIDLDRTRATGRGSWRRGPRPVP